MKSISSSFFGRLFGNATKLIIKSNGLSVSIKGVTTEIDWQSLSTPPKFTSRLLGQTVSFTTTDKSYLLSKMAYNSTQKHQQHCERLWIDNNKSRVKRLLAKIDLLIGERYLRQSSIERIQRVITLESKRWFPWAQSSTVLLPDIDLLHRLKHYQQWQDEDIDACREAYITKQLLTHKKFFDNVESNPLTQKQRRACVIDDDNNLLLAGAGTGKTSVMVGRAGYLLKSLQAKPHEILLLAYGRKAAGEMDGRIKEKLATNKIGATTFHRLGLDIIEKVEGVKPNLSQLATDEKSKAQWVQRCFEQLIKTNQQYRQQVMVYFSQYFYVEKNETDFSTLGDYYQYLTDNDIKSLKGDKVKSVAELHIANWLFCHGIAYRYQANYEFDIKTAERKQYRPDFFLPEFNVYIEYYGIDKNGNTAPYVDKTQYQASMQWKAQTHKVNGTQCITLTYAQHQKGQLLNSLKLRLKETKIKFEILPDKVIFASLAETGGLTTLTQILTQLIALYKGACLDENAEREIINNAVDSKQTEKAFALLKPIFVVYQTKLKNDNEIDFDDMIAKALEYIETGKFHSPWRYIMVDEFQDISEPRARLVKALRDSHEGSSIFAVGDDWQAIYRFSGADVTLTTGFEDYFGTTKQTQLDQTFRFNNRIGQVATEFVSKNPAQIKKTIHSTKQVTMPAISILRKCTTTSSSSSNQATIAEMTNGAIDDVLLAIANKVNKPCRVYLLARFWFQLPDKATVSRLKVQYPKLNIETQSIHAAKGKEADFVVIMGLTQGKHGFPSKKVTPSILDSLLVKEERFEHAEERRLFYVALTRAKHRVYIIADMVATSIFVKELIKEHDVELNEFNITVRQSAVKQIKCLVCETGTLKPRIGQYGTFYSCSHFPRCDHNERGCGKCTSVMAKNKSAGFKTCLSPSCDGIVPICEKCGAEMVLRKSAKGEFWGCENFRGNDKLSCKNSIDKSAMRWPKLTR